MFYRICVRQEAVSMVISDRDRHIKSKRKSCDTLTPPLYLLSFPGCYWRERPLWTGWRYWPAGTAGRRGPCWADGREGRASKISYIANFISEATMSKNTYSITIRRWVINNMCSRFGTCHYETERAREGENINVIKLAFLGASSLPGTRH